MSVSKICSSRSHKKLVPQSVITCSELLPLLSSSRPLSFTHEQPTIANSSSFSSEDIDLRDPLPTCNTKRKISIERKIIVQYNDVIITNMKFVQHRAPIWDRLCTYTQHLMFSLALS